MGDERHPEAPIDAPNSEGEGVGSIIYPMLLPAEIWMVVCEYKYRQWGYASHIIDWTLHTPWNQIMSLNGKHKADWSEEQCNIIRAYFGVSPWCKIEFS